MSWRASKPGTFIPPRPSHSMPKTKIMMPDIIEVPLKDRVKQLMIFAETPEEIDALAEAYRKISNK